MCKASEKTNVHLADSFQGQFTSNIYDVNDNHQEESFDDQMQSIERIPVPVYSPPLSLPEDNDRTPYSLTSECSCNSTSLCLQGDEVGTLFSRILVIPGSQF